MPTWGATGMRSNACVPLAPPAPPQAALRQLWAAAFPGSPFPEGVKHERWKELGWQSDDPGRDFRCAALCLHSCLHVMVLRAGRRNCCVPQGALPETEAPPAVGAGRAAT